MNGPGDTAAVTPAELRELAALAVALEREIDAVRVRLRAASDEPTQRVGFRLDSAAGWAGQVGSDVLATASDLARVRGRGACGADWGACPDHGATLTGSGGRSWCTARGCSRRWGYDRCGLPCTEDVAFDVRDGDGNGGPMCAGHTLAARVRLVGAVVTELDGSR